MKPFVYVTQNVWGIDHLDKRTYHPGIVFVRYPQYATLAFAAKFGFLLLNLLDRV